MFSGSPTSGYDDAISEALADIRSVRTHRYPTVLDYPVRVLPDPTLRCAPLRNGRLIIK